VRPAVAAPESPQEQRTKNGLFILPSVFVALLIGAVVVPQLSGRTQCGNGVAEQIRLFQTSLDMYRMDNGFHPSTKQGLQALITEPTGEPAPKKWKQYLNVSTLPDDPWDQNFVYTLIDAHHFDIRSMGPDGLLATEDDIVAP
jgi:general secretion pathway protein G